jgi:hypothetical protein
MIVSALLVAMLTQAPAQPTARVPVQRRQKPDTVYVAMPPAVVMVEAQSQLPAIILGVLGLILVGFQVAIMRKQSAIMARQTEAMNTQGELMAKQNALADEQATWRRNEAIGTFYRMAFDLAEEFRKANYVGFFECVPANYDTHPRQVLRQASAMFVPLGNAFVMAANQAGLRLDEYFSAVEYHNKTVAPLEGARGVIPNVDLTTYNSVQSMREIVGGDLDLANGRIPPELRWKYDNGKDYSFRQMCGKPAPMRETAGG